MRRLIGHLLKIRRSKAQKLQSKPLIGQNCLPILLLNVRKIQLKRRSAVAVTGHSDSSIMLLHNLCA